MSEVKNTMSAVPNLRSARIRALRGAAMLLDSALYNGDGWAFDENDGEPVSERDAARIVRAIEELAMSLRQRADTLEEKRCPCVDRVEEARKKAHRRPRDVAPFGV